MPYISFNPSQHVQIILLQPEHVNLGLEEYVHDSLNTSFVYVQNYRFKLAVLKYRSNVINPSLIHYQPKRLEILPPMLPSVARSLLIDVKELDVGLLVLTAFSHNVS